MIRRLTAIAALLIVGQAYAQSFIADTIPYAPEAKVADRIRQECTDLGTNLSRKIIEQVWGGGYFCTGMTGGKKRRKTLSGADLSEAGARKNLHQLLL